MKLVVCEARLPSNEVLSIFGCRKWQTECWSVVLGLARIHTTTNLGLGYLFTDHLTSEHKFLLQLFQ